MFSCLILIIKPFLTPVRVAHSRRKDAEKDINPEFDFLF